MKKLQFFTFFGIINLLVNFVNIYCFNEVALLYGSSL